MVAVIGQNRDADTARNDFGKRFRAAAEQLKLSKTHDGFDTAMIEIKSDDFRNFIDRLANLE